MTTLEPRTRLRPSVLLNLTAVGAVSAPAKSQTLTQAVQSAVRGVSEDALRPVAGKDAGMAFQPKTLLAILSYCYARQIYSSADVEDLMRRDTNFRGLCAEEFPASRVLRRFRRDNREALHCCLVAALRRLAANRAQAGLTAVASEADLSEEASRRITMAMFIDSMEVDDA